MFPVVNLNVLSKLPTDWFKKEEDDANSTAGKVGSALQLSFTLRLSESTACISQYNEVLLGRSKLSKVVKQM